MPEPRVAVLVERIDFALRELDRIRARLHNLETDRATVGLLKRLVEDLTEDLPNLARQAAREAVTEFLQRKHADTLGNWRTYAAIMSAGVALGALIVALVIR